MFKLTKKHEGQSFICMPTQNNVRRGGSSAIDQARLRKITDIKVKTCTITYSKYSLSCYGQDATRAQYDNKNNSGYLVFETEAHFDDYKARLLAEKVIRDRLSGYGQRNLSDDQVIRIANIIKEEK